MTWSGDKDPIDFMDWSVDSEGNFFMDIPLSDMNENHEVVDMDNQMEVIDTNLINKLWF